MLYLLFIEVYTSHEMRCGGRNKLRGRIYKLSYFKASIWQPKMWKGISTKKSLGILRWPFEISRSKAFMHQEYSKTLHYAGEYQSSSSAKTLPNKRSVTIKTKKSALPSKITVLLHIKMFFETGQRRKRVPQSQKLFTKFQLLLRIKPAIITTSIPQASTMNSTARTECLYCSVPCTKQCSKCASVYFCSEAHQRLVSGFSSGWTEPACW